MTGSKRVEATLDPNITADEVVYVLAKKNFIVTSPYDYRLRVKRLQKMLLPNQTLASAGVEDYEVIFVEAPHVSDHTQRSPNQNLDNIQKQSQVEFIKEYGSLAFNGASYRSWWHSILRDYGKYACYGIFLLLPSDVHLLGYLTDYGHELNILSSHCLIIAPSPHGVKNPEFQIDVWKNSVHSYVRDGYGRFFSSLFSIPFSSYPCFAVFNDFQSADYALVSLKEMNAQEISVKLRSVFSIIDKAASSKEKPVKLIENFAVAEKINEIGIHVMTDIKSLTKTTFETLIETLIKSALP